jgi:opacity protein-like surface antigen
MTRGIAAVVCLLVLPASTTAQQATVPAITIRAFGDAGVDRFNASQSFTAIFDSSAGAIYGGGAEAVLRPGWWLRVGAWRFTDEGERALRLENQTFRLGIPLTVTIVPVEVSGGYRFRRHSRVIPYVGGGMSRHSYEEASRFADGTENVSESFTGYQALAGVEYRLHRWIGVAAEVQYTTVPDAIGAGGISADFNEQDLGGTIVRARFLFGR